MNQYSPLLLHASNGRQKLALVEFNNYTSVFDFYSGQSNKIETLQYLTSNDNEMNAKFNYADMTIDFFVQQDKITYKYYPIGLLQGLSKLGGIIAIFNIGILLNAFH